MLSINNFFPKNYKGAEKILSVYWFIILIIVSGGIFAMVYTFYHHPYDIREIESDIMVNKVSDCLAKDGKLKENFNENLKDNFLEKCSLNFYVEEIWNKEEQYYLQVNFYKFNELESSLLEISNGNKNLISGCKEQNDKEYKRLAKCVERSFYSLDENNDLFLIKILSIVRKTEKNVKF